MNCLLVFPPQWVPFNPHLAIPAIQSILRHTGHAVTTRDLNAEFYAAVLTSGFIKESVKYAFDDFRANAASVYSQFTREKSIQDYPAEFRNQFQRYNEIKKVSNNNEFGFVIDNISEAVAIIRDKKQYYKLDKLEWAFATIHKATRILSSVYYPSKMYFMTAQAQVFYTVDDLKRDCLNKNGNIFYKFFENIEADLIKDDYDYIGISIGDFSQLVAGLTLAMMLKGKVRAHLNIGGNLFGRYTDVLINSPDFFNTFVDSIIYHEGERPVLELMQHLNGDLPLEHVSNLIYLSGSSIQVNKESEPQNVSQLPPPDYSGLPFEKYFTPEVIFNVQASRNCYWKRCTFCTHHFGSKYAAKDIDTIISEIKQLQQEFGANYFHFVDEAISPAYLGKLSRQIIDEGLHLNFYIYARLEKGFTPELLSLARQAGLRLIMWGFEAASERVYRLMDKGELCSSESRLRIIQNAFDADIWNHLFIMFGFPSESLEEAKETVHFLKENRIVTSHSSGGTFVLLENAPILKNLGKYYITDFKRVRSGFSFAHRFKTRKGMDERQLDELEIYKNEHWEMSKLKYVNTWYREKLFLYVCRYGATTISRMREKVWI